jgi:hypothetical protein
MEGKEKGGRPTKYKAEYDLQVYKLCLLGSTDSDIASFFEVAESTVNLWKKQHESFNENLRNGKALADAEIAHALFNRAKGMTVKEKKVRTFSDGTIETIITTKEIVPDSGACMNFLANRQPTKWRKTPDLIEEDKNETGSLTIVIGTKGIKELPSHEDDIIDFTLEQ